MADVIVIGGGGAGLLAALKAREHGAEVTLVSKTPVGLAGCTTHSGGGFTLGTGDMTPEQHAALTLKSGRGISDERLVALMAREAPARVEGLRRYGVELRLRSGGAYAGEGLGDLIRGRGITGPLVDSARRAGVRILDRTMATGLLISDGRTSGVEVFDISTGRADVMPCSAVVVAAGGAGRIYSRTDNPVRTTGDGYWLLAKAGATFRDMEFVQFYPLGLDEPGFPVWMVDLGLIDFCRLTNARGEEFLKKRLQEWGISSGREANLVARDSCTVEVAKQVAETGRVQLHLDEIDADAITSNWHRASLNGVLRMYPRGRSPAAGPVGVSPVQHYFCGGVVIDERASTGIPGVFACGEVTGGVDGANRVGGNALTNLSVFGPIAGESAARFALSHPSRDLGRDAGEGADGCAAASLLKRWSANRGPAPAELKKEINRVCDAYLGPIRNTAGLKEALRLLGSIGAESERISAGSPAEAAAAFECLAMVATASMVADSALRREESRGVHYRSDFPAENPRLASPIYIR